MSGVPSVKREDLQQSAQIPPQEVQLPPLIPPPAAAASPLGVGRATADITEPVAAAKKKKKKKKPKESMPPLAAPLAALAANTSGFSPSRAAAILSLNVGMPRTGQRPRSSIIETQAFRRLEPGEREIVLGMLNRWPLSDQLCLIDIFGVDLMTDWDDLIKSAEKYGELPQALKAIQDDFFCQFFMSFIYFVGKCAEHPTLQEALTCPKFFRTEAGMAADIDSAIQRLQFLSLARPKEEGKRGSKLKALQQKQNEAFVAKITQLTDKLTVLSKIYRSPDAYSLLVVEALNIFAEAQTMNRPAPERVPSLLQFTQFINRIMEIGVRRSVVGTRMDCFNHFEGLIKKMAASGVTPELAALFNRHYVQYSHSIGREKEKFTRFVQRACSDPAFTHAQYCGEMGIRALSQQNQKDFIAHLFAQFSMLDLCDSWVDDYEDILSHTCSVALGGRFYRPSKQYTLRLVFNFNQSLRILKETNFARPLPDPSSPIQSFEMMASIGVGKQTQRLLECFERIDIAAVHRQIMELIQSPRFSLSQWQQHLRPLMQFVPELETASRDLDTLRQELLLRTREAKESGQLDQSNPTVLKEVLKKSLLNHSQLLCHIMMILEDVRVLYDGGDTSDILHLFPEPVAKFLDLDGFDDIFPAPPSPEPLSPPLEEKPLGTEEADAAALPPETPLVATAAAAAAFVEEGMLTKPAPPVRPVAKREGALASAAARPERQIPDKREFTQERRRRVILRVLKDLGFESDGTGEHEKLRHRDTRGTVALPLSLEADGTRKSVYNQMVKALPGSSGSAEDKEAE